LVVSREGKIVAEAGSGTGGRWGCEAAQLERRPLRRAQGPAGNGVVRLRWQEGGGWGGGANVIKTSIGMTRLKWVGAKIYL
jgi:hypothetical protein